MEGWQQERLKNGVPPFLILLDMHLPHISGADLLTNIIKKDERFAKSHRDHYDCRCPYGGSVYRAGGFCDDQAHLVRPVT